MTEKKKKLNKKFSIEELYQNKNFVPPKEKNLETIFEEPRQAKDGAPILTSVRKYKRYLHFDPTEGKIHKRKLKAKKCLKKMKTGKLRTRSTSKKTECDDISMYILQAIGDSSDSEMEQGTDAKDKSTSCTPNDSKVDITKPNENEVDSNTSQNSEEIAEQVAGDIEINKITNSQEGVTISEECKCETESVADAISEETESKDVSRSSCILT